MSEKKEALNILGHAFPSAPLSRRWRESGNAWDSAMLANVTRLGSGSSRCFSEEKTMKNHNSEGSFFRQSKFCESHRPPKFSLHKLFLLATHKIRSHYSLKLLFLARFEGHSSSPVDSSTQKNFNFPSLLLHASNTPTVFWVCSGSCWKISLLMQQGFKIFEELIQQSLYLLCRLHWSQHSSLCIQSLWISVRALYSAIKELQAEMNLILSSFRQLGSHQPPILNLTTEDSLMRLKEDHLEC